jgi:hypothetical protein
MKTSFSLSDQIGPANCVDNWTYKGYYIMNTMAEEELRSPKEAGVNRVCVRRTSVATP